MRSGFEGRARAALDIPAISNRPRSEAPVPYQLNPLTNERL